jgi:tetratricopeptide (TPR) repeat protein
MATEDQENSLDQSDPEAGAKGRPSADQAPAKGPDSEASASRDDSRKSPKDSAPNVGPENRRTGKKADQSPPNQKPRKRFSTVQKVLAAAIVAIISMLAYAMLTSRAQKGTGTESRPTHKGEPHLRQTAYPVRAADNLGKETPIRATESHFDASSDQPLSLSHAQHLCTENEFDEAYAAYERLCKSLPAGSEDVQDFMKLRMAVCARRAADFKQADELLRAASKSRSAVVRVMVHYHRSFLEMENEQYLNARTSAYKALALIEAAYLGKDFAMSMKNNCSFLVAEAVTRYVLSLCPSQDLPERLWANSVEGDPLVNLDETQLRSILNRGANYLDAGLLGPQIQRLEHGDGPASWSVVCNGAPLEELLAKFAGNARFDVSWSPNNEQNSNDTLGPARRRRVVLFLKGVTSQELIRVGAGCAGLLGQLNERNVAIVSDPTGYSSLSEHLSLLSQEATSLWQKFLLTSGDDKRLSNAHFALALLSHRQGNVTESVAEYKLVANRFSTTHLAPYALFHSSELKADLRDYEGARGDLNFLVEQHPDSEIAGQARLRLADITSKCGLEAEAGRLYGRLYNLNLSPDSKRAAAFGAACCFYKAEDYESAEKWLARHISVVKDANDKRLYSAYFLLGKTSTALGKLHEACDAFQYALRGPISSGEYVEAVSVLVEGLMQQEQFVQALGIVEDACSAELSQRESTEILLLKSRILRAMGLVDKAVAALGDRVEYTTDPLLKAKLAFELANCDIENGDLDVACGKLTEILANVESGPVAHEIAFQLADVCMKLGQDSKAVSICTRLLDSDAKAELKKRTLRMLATAYGQQKEYERAVLALVGQWK